MCVCQAHNNYICMYTCRFTCIYIYILLYCVGRCGPFASSGYQSTIDYVFATVCLAFKWCETWECTKDHSLLDRYKQVASNLVRATRLQKRSIVTFHVLSLLPAHTARSHTHTSNPLTSASAGKGKPYLPLKPWRIPSPSS